MEKTFCIYDKLNKPLKIGDDVLFPDDGELVEGTITSFFYHEWFWLDKATKLGYTKLVPVTEETDISDKDIFAYIGYEGVWDEDHYGKTIDGTFHYGKFIQKRVRNIVRKKNEDEYYDYDIIEYQKNKCSHCKYYDGYDMCKRKGNFGAISYGSIVTCVKNKLFKDKNVQKETLQG